MSGGKLFNVFKTAAKDWVDDKAPRLGAALSFYTLFSLAPLLVMLVAIAGLWASGSSNATDEVFSQIGSFIGKESAKDLQEMISQPGKENQGMFATIAAGVMLVFGATGVFVQLQNALNEIWEVEQKPGQGIMGFIRHRLLSFAMVLGIAFLLLTSLVLSAGLSAMGKFMGGWFGNMEWLVHALNFILSFGVITGLFALMFKYIPDAKVAWKDVCVGAVATAALFAIGKYLLAMYIGKSALVSTYAAASALIVVLLWVYYSSQILFFGAELTQAYAYASGREVAPSEHAQWDEEKLCAAEAARKKRGEKEHDSRGGRASKPEFGYAAAPAVGGMGALERGEAFARARVKRHLNAKSILAMAVVGAVLWPVRRHLKIIDNIRKQL